jgi:hypothetical protein
MQTIESHAREAMWRYYRLLPIFEEFLRLLRRKLEACLHPISDSVSQIDARVKSCLSFQQKVLRQPGRYQEPIKDLI